MNLEPVEFTYKNDENDTKHIGLIAEDVYKLFPEIVVLDKDGKPFSINYELLSIILLVEFQKLNKLLFK